MKKLLLILLCVPLIGLSQIKKIEKNWETIIVGKLPDRGLGTMKIIKETLIDGNIVAYSFMFKNCKYMEIKDVGSFSFIETDGDFEGLYSMIIDGYKILPKDNEIRLDIGDGNTLILEYKSDFGLKSMRFYHIDNNSIHSWSQWLIKKQMKKLFTKR
tara:strand:+ start:42 stop:512 length:471 start_codon:yes stop_codon:yes gene_type:complete